MKTVASDGRERQKTKQNNDNMNTKTINEIIANVPSTFEKSLRYGEWQKYLTDWNVSFHYKGMEVEAAVVKSSKRIDYQKKLSDRYYETLHVYDLNVRSVYVNGKRLKDAAVYGNTDSENIEAIENLKQKILEIVKIQPQYEENLMLFNEIYEKQR